ASFATFGGILNVPTGIASTTSFGLPLAASRELKITTELLALRFFNAKLAVTCPAAFSALTKLVTSNSYITKDVPTMFTVERGVAPGGGLLLKVIPVSVQVSLSTEQMLVATLAFCGSFSLPMN